MKKIVNVIVLMLVTLLMLMAAGQTALAEEQAISAKEMMRLLDDFVQEIAPESWTNGWRCSLRHETATRH